MESRIKTHELILRIRRAISSPVITSFLRDLFHWKHSGVLIPTFVGLGVAMIALAYEVPVDVSSPIWGATFAFFSLAGFWSLGFWWNSDFLSARKPKPTRSINPKRMQRYRASLLRLRLLRWCVSAAIAGSVIVASSFTRKLEIAKGLEERTGYLYPGNTSIKGICSDPPAGVLHIFWGDTVESYFTTFPFTITFFHRTDITIDRATDGALLISTSLKSDDGKIMVEIVRGRFIVNAHTTLEFVRPDKSTLTVRDDYGNTILGVKFVNPTEIRIVGRFSLSRSEAVVVDPDDLHTEGIAGQTKFRYACLLRWGGFLQQ